MRTHGGLGAAPHGYRRRVTGFPGEVWFQFEVDVEVKAPSVLYFNPRHYNMSDASRWDVHVYLNPSDASLETKVSFTSNKTMEVLIVKKHGAGNSWPPWPPRERKIVADVQVVYKAGAKSDENERDGLKVEYDSAGQHESLAATPSHTAGDSSDEILYL